MIQVSSFKLERPAVSSALSRHCSDKAERLKTRAPLPCKHAHVFSLEPNIHQSHPWRRWGLTVTSALNPSSVHRETRQLLACHCHGDGALPYVARASSYLIPSSSHLTVGTYVNKDTYTNTCIYTFSSTCTCTYTSLHLSISSPSLPEACLR